MMMHIGETLKSGHTTQTFAVDLLLNLSDLLLLLLFLGWSGVSRTRVLLRDHGGVLMEGRGRGAGERETGGGR